MSGTLDPKPHLTIRLCAPRGFCAGVVRAIDAVEKALEIYGAPVYVRHEIVHNKYVVDGLRAKGAIFVDELDEVHRQQPQRHAGQRILLASAQEVGGVSRNALACESTGALEAFLADEIRKRAVMP